eukprot:s2125_g4.t1
MDLYGGGGLSSGDHAVPGDWMEDDIVMMDEGGDEPPIPESSADLPDPEDPLQEQSHPAPTGDGPAQSSMRTAFDVWHKLVEEATNVGVKNLTFVEVLHSRAVSDVLPALARIHARLHALGLPILRIHCDRARELVSAPVRRWTLDRGIITTLTTGSSFKSNGRVEAEVGATKRAVRTLISAKLCPLDHWPLAARHIGERRLRCQLQRLGWPTAPMLSFGTKAFALRKSWQERYSQWRDAREPVLIMGPDKFSSLTTTSYFVKSLNTGKFFFTDDVIEPPRDAPQHLSDLPGEASAEEPAIYLEERGETASPPPWPSIPGRRLRGKTTVPAVRSMGTIEGETVMAIGGGPRLFALSGSQSQNPQINVQVDDAPNEAMQSQLNRPMVFHYDVPEHLQQFFELEDVDGSDEESWSLGTDPDNTSASSQASTPSCQTDAAVEESGGGEKEEAPNNWDGGSCPVASNMSGQEALRTMHQNVAEYIRMEINKIDATSGEQALWLPVVSEAIGHRVALERQLRQLQVCDEAEAQRHLEQEFLVTKTISNAEVWNDLEAWRPSIEQEYQQLVHDKGAVRQVTMKELQQLSQQKGVPIELLPGKTVHTRKAQTGAYRSRAVICGNYATQTDQEVYAGGSDCTQVRTALKTASVLDWKVMGTDVRTAFLNAKRRDESKLVAMSIPSIFKRLGLASDDDVWVVEMALYGLTTSPRDWGIHRDLTLAKLTWSRVSEDGVGIKGHFEKTQDDNLWRLIETDGQGHRWCGLLCVYVDDLLFCGEEDVLRSALSAVESEWSCAAAEWATESKPLKFCGMEITVDQDKNGLHLAQSGYEQELLDRWQVSSGVDYPHFKLSEADFEPSESIDPKVLKEAQALAGGLLWLATKTRPDLAYGVSAMTRLMSRNPQKALEVGHVLLKYIKAKPGDLHYFKYFSNDGWGERAQLKAQRNQHSIEVFSDIAYAAGTAHRSVQGIAVFFAGSPIAWQSSQQPFVTHSTAEAELVSYCESLLIGRATEALLCSMWGEPLTNKNKFSRTIYGDNMAAIGLASGTTCSSWRTRHLRIRASILREAMDEECEIPGGVWRLLHLKGTELVADGLTKQLLGQAFDRFVSDLGLKRSTSSTSSTHASAAATAPVESTQNTEVDPSATVMALMTAGMLLSGADVAYEDEADTESQAIWACGAILMTLGTIYATKLAASGVKCCVRRLCGSLHWEEDRRPSSKLGPVSESGDSENEVELPKMTSSSATKRSNVSTPVEDSFERPLQPSENGAGAPISTTVRTPSGSGNAAGSMSRNIPSSSGSHGSSSRSSLSLRTQSGLTSASSRKASRQSGSAAAAERAALPTSAADGAALHTAAAESAVSAASSSAAAECVATERGDSIKNPWNLFQHDHKGLGLTSKILAKMYHDRLK